MNNSGRITVSQTTVSLLMTVLTVLTFIPGFLLYLLVRAYYAAITRQKTA